MTVQQELATADGGFGQQGPLPMTLLRKGLKFRTEMNVQGMTMITIFDGTDVWMVTPMGAQKMPMQMPMPDMGPGKAWPEDARLAGTETVSGRDCCVIEYKDPKNGAPTRLWVDRKSPTAVKSETKQGAETLVALFSDFRNVQGAYEMPYKCDMSSNGKPKGTLTIKSIKVNTGLADDLFNPQSPTAGTPTATP
jgi:outer membrane lipoprotein-sorting protein